MSPFKLFSKRPVVLTIMVEYHTWQKPTNVKILGFVILLKFPKKILIIKQYFYYGADCMSKFCVTMRYIYLMR